MLTAAELEHIETCAATHTADERLWELLARVAVEVRALRSMADEDWLERVRVRGSEPSSASEGGGAGMGSCGAGSDGTLVAAHSREARDGANVGGPQCRPQEGQRDGE